MKIVMKKALAANSVGIIGGSDGPTAVFIATKPSFWILAAAVAALAGAVLFWCLKKRKR